jgi:hypothetical protein
MLIDASQEGWFAFDRIDNAVRPKTSEYLTKKRAELLAKKS